MDSPTSSWMPHPIVLRVAAYAVCLIVVGLASGMVLELVSQLSIVLVPLLVAAYLTRILAVPGNWLTDHGWRPAPAAATVLVGFLALIAGLVWAVVPPMVDEFSLLGETIEDGTEQVKDWLVEDSSFDVSRADIQEFEDTVSERGRDALSESTDSIARGARLVVEVVVSLVLALVLTFFAIKDGTRLQAWARSIVPRRRRPQADEVARSAWTTLGGYLRGSAMLGLVEGIIIGGVMTLTGARLALPVALLTFAAAFVPLVGATVAGVIAVLVTLASAGLTEALIVAVVALLVQQFDNDLLAPWIFGKALSLHPVVILLSIAAGTALFGFVGTLLAVPVTAIAIDAVAILRQPPPDDDEPLTDAGAPPMES
jgi:predicted PurR-regulated permease PerM